MSVQLIKGAVILSLILAAALAQQATWTANDIYKDCLPGGGIGVSKTCFGDTEICIQHTNCTFIVTVTENRTHFVAETQTNCDGRKDYGAFFGVGVPALSKKNSDMTPKYTCTPKFQDYKFVILWTGDKECASKGEVQKKWGVLQKGILPDCKESPPVDDLEEFLTNHMMVQSGTIPHELIADKRYESKNDGVFFTNSGFLPGPTGLLFGIASLTAIFSYNGL